MFEISVKRRFPASHALGKDGALIEEPHEHEWECEITLSSPDVDEAGMLVDFRDLDATIDEALKPLTGRALHVIEQFSGMSASAENVARHIFDELKKSLNSSLKRVRIWEDADHSATYYE